MKARTKKRLARHWAHAQTAWRIAAFLLAVRSAVKNI